MRRRRLVLWIMAAFAVCWFGSVAAQPVVKTLQHVNATVSPPGQPSQGSSSSGLNEEQYLVEGESLYHHMADRDPFTPLVGKVGTGKDVKTNPGTRGISRYTVEDCTLEMIVKTPQQVQAWFQGPDGKAYKVLAGDKFSDGVVLSISSQDGAIVIQQELNDPTAIKPFRNLVLRIKRKGKGEGK